MNKRIAINARKEKVVSLEAAKELKSDVVVDAVDVKAEAADAIAEAAEILELDAAEANKEVAEAAEELKIVADAAFNAAEAIQTEVQKTEVSGDKSAEEILAEIAAIKLKREQLAKEKEAIRAELKRKRDIEKALAALEAERKALADEESAEVTLEDEASDNAGILGKDYKVSQKAQDELMIAALKASGNTVERIGIAREYWKKHSAEFRAITKEKQQKAIMRRCINRLIAAGIVEHEGTRLTLKLEKLEALKTAESK